MDYPNSYAFAAYFSLVGAVGAILPYLVGVAIGAAREFLRGA